MRRSTAATAIRSGEITTLRAFLRLTVIADAWLTAPAVVFQTASGAVLMKLLDWPLTSDWSILVWVLYIFVGACWLPLVAMQIWLLREAQRATSMAALSARLHRVFRWWFAFGVPAFTAVVLLFYLMASKPLPVT